MKNFVFVLLFFFSATLFGQTKVENKVVLIGCGMCQFKIKSEKKCAAFVKIDGDFYQLEGVNKSIFGDPDAAGGYCTVTKKARVSGEIKKGKFFATSFSFIDQEM